MRFGGLAVEFDRFFRGGQRAWVGLRGRHHGVFAQQVVAVGESDIGGSIAGIVDDGLGERVHRLVQAVGSALLPVVTAFEVELLGFAIGGMMSEARFQRQKARDGRRGTLLRCSPWRTVRSMKHVLARRSRATNSNASTGKSKTNFQRRSRSGSSAHLFGFGVRTPVRAAVRRCAWARSSDSRGVRRFQ